MTGLPTIHVRVVSPISTQGFRAAGALAALEGPGIVVSGSQISRGPGSIESEYETAMSVPDTVARIIEAEREGVDAVVNLQVPLINGRLFDRIKDTYDYKHLHN